MPGARRIVECQDMRPGFCASSSGNQSCSEVCFFTSYRYLEQVLEKWYETGTRSAAVSSFEDFGTIYPRSRVHFAKPSFGSVPAWD